jgi:hypothetical protein
VRAVPVEWQTIHSPVDKVRQTTPRKRHPLKFVPMIAALTLRYSNFAEWHFLGAPEPCCGGRTALPAQRLLSKTGYNEAMP